MPIEEHVEKSFKIGDLVCYSPYFEGDGGWFMSGDLGVVIAIRHSSDYNVYHIKWIDPTLGSNDMAAEVLTKVKIKKNCDDKP